MPGSSTVFVSYSSRDERLAAAIHAYLLANGIKAVKAPEDIRPGQDWAGAIAQMIDEATHMVLIWTSHSMASKEVAKELTLAMQSNTVIIPFQVQDLEPEGAWRYHLANLHWLQAHNTDEDTAFRTLLSQISGQAAVQAPLANPVFPVPRARKTPGSSAARSSLAAVGSLVCSCLALVINLVALLAGIWFGITLPTLKSSAVALVATLYRAIPPFSMILYVLSIGLAITALMRGSRRRSVAITALLLTGLQLVAYVVGWSAKILPH